MRSRAGGSLVVGLGVAAILAVASAPPVVAATDPTPSSDPSGETATDPPADPSDPPTSDPSDPPTSDPSDPPTSDPPTDPPTSDPPTDPSDPPTSDPPTDPSDPPTTPPPGDPGPVTPPANPVLSLWLSTSSSTVKPGGTITTTVKVTSAKATANATVLRLATTGASVSPTAQGLGSVGGGGRTARATIKAPANAKPGTIKLKATVSASKAATVSRSYSLIITTASGALPPGITLSNLPSDLPPLTPPPYDPMAGFPAFPQVALPPVASPQIAPSPAPITSSAVLRANNLTEGFGTDDLAAIQAGWLAALATSSALVLARARLARRNPLPAHVRRWLAGRPRTPARLRTVPPRPAPVPSRVFWLPLHPKSAVRL